MAAEDILYYGLGVVIALVAALIALRLLRRGGGGGGPPKLSWYVMRTVQNRRQVVAQGKVPNTAESFKLKNHTYHVDLAKVQQDAGGHQYLNYDWGYFEPLSKGDVPDDEMDLKVHPSADAHMVLNTGWIRQMLGMISGKSGLSIMMIVMAVMGGVMGYFIGSSAPLSGFLNPPVTNYATVSYSVSSTYTTSGLTFTTTYVTRSLSKIPAGYYTLTQVETATGTQTITSISLLTGLVSYLTETVPFSTTRNFTLTSTYNYTTTSNVTRPSTLLVYVPYNVTLTYSATHTVTEPNATITATSTTTSTTTSVTTSTLYNQTTTTTTT